MHDVVAGHAQIVADADAEADACDYPWPTMKPNSFMAAAEPVYAPESPTPADFALCCGLRGAGRDMLPAYLCARRTQRRKVVPMMDGLVRGGFSGTIQALKDDVNDKMPLSLWNESVLRTTSVDL